LTVKGSQVSDLLDADVSFVTELASAGCITWSQREHLNNILQPRDRNVKLIEFLTRRSVAHFQKFINVLAKEQSHLVPVLLSNGGEIFCFMYYSVVDCYSGDLMMGIVTCYWTTKPRRTNKKVDGKHQ